MLLENPREHCELMWRGQSVDICRQALRFRHIDRHGNAAERRADATAAPADRLGRPVAANRWIGVKQQISGSKRQDAAGVFPLSDPPH